MKRSLLAVVLAGVMVFPAVTAVAQEQGDVPEQGVARISLLSGDVTVQRGDSGEVIEAEVNSPLVARDHLITGMNARAEIQLDWANMMRLASGSEVRMADLQDRRYRVELNEGMITLRVLRDSDGRLEIATPTASLHPKDKGTYRITVRQDFSTEVVVRSGNIDVFVDRQFSNLRSGDVMIIDGDPANPGRVLAKAGPKDEWDRWNESRDRDLERSDSYKYVSRDIYGADDLYGHGRWIYDSPYGWVWAPYVAVDWAPYRVGRWVSSPYYGWTWISGDPWGWAPYHYGRWYQAARYGWVWYPGPIRDRYYWRPALVGFFGWDGGGVNVHVSFGFGNVGWVPLAPREIYRPWYGRNVTIVNVINRVEVVNNYRNARIVGGRDAFTAVHANDFGRRRTNVTDFVRVNDRSPSRVLDTRSRAGTFDTPRDNPRDNVRATDRPAGGRGNVQSPQNSPERNRPNQPEVVRGPESQQGQQSPGNRGRGNGQGNNRSVENNQPAGQVTGPNQPGIIRGPESQPEQQSPGNRGRGNGQGNNNRSVENNPPAARSPFDAPEARTRRDNMDARTIAPGNQPPQQVQSDPRIVGGRPGFDPGRPGRSIGTDVGIAAPQVREAPQQNRQNNRAFENQGRAGPAQPQGGGGGGVMRSAPGRSEAPSQGNGGRGNGSGGGGVMRSAPGRAEAAPQGNAGGGGNGGGRGNGGGNGGGGGRGRR